MNAKVAFIHGRPGPHPMHAQFACSIGADFHLVDFLLRWNDLPASRWRRYLSWLICAFRFPNRTSYSVFLTEGPHFPPVIMKWSHLLNRKQIVVALMDNETLYFLSERRYSNTTAWALTKALSSYDALLCTSHMATQLAREVLTPVCPPVYRVFNGISAERQQALRQVRPDLMGSEILFIGHGPHGWRVWYKGLDLMVEAFRLSFQENRRLRFTVVGEWDKQVVKELVGQYPIRFAGASKELEEFLTRSALYLHCGRGDAWGISILEAMWAGVVPLVSEWTGAREVVAQVSPSLIVPLEAKAIADRILWYFNLPVAQRQALSQRCREVVANYTEERSLLHFVCTFRTMLQDLGLPHLSPEVTQAYAKRE